MALTPQFTHAVPLPSTALGQVLDEFLETEATYLADMRFVIREFAEPLEPLLPPSLHDALFVNLVSEIEPLHAALSTRLGERRHASVEERVGDLASVFLAVLPQFPCYSTYCANYAYVADALAQVMELQPAAEAVRAAEARLALERGSASLAARLFRPVQRMCIYPLLFREMLKHGQESPGQAKGTAHEAEEKAEEKAEETAIVDAHRASLHRAMSAMHAVVMQVNEEVRKLETQLQLLQLLAGSLLSPRFSVQRDLGPAIKRETRVLLHEAMVGMRQTQPRGWAGKLRLHPPKLTETTWCVFTDILMICRRHKGGGEGGACHALLPLLQISIDPKPGTDMLTLHRRLPLAPGGKREAAVAYEWQCRCSSEIMPYLLWLNLLLPYLLWLNLLLQVRQ